MLLQHQIVAIVAIVLVTVIFSGSNAQLLSCKLRPLNTSRTVGLATIDYNSSFDNGTIDIHLSNAPAAFGLRILPTKKNATTIAEYTLNPNVTGFTLLLQNLTSNQALLTTNALFLDVLYNDNFTARCTITNPCYKATAEVDKYGWRAWVTLSVLLCMLVLLIFEPYPAWFIIFATQIVYILTGIVPMNQALSSFSNEGMLTVAFLFPVVAPISKNKLVIWITKFLLGSWKSVRFSLVRMMIPLCVLSGFTNNTPMCALMIPVIKDWCRLRGFAPSKFMMPMSYALISGGLITLIGTSTNIVASGFMQQYGLEEMGFFELAYIGLPLSAATVVYIFIFECLLPNNKGGMFRLAREEGREFLSELIIAPKSPLVGKTVTAAIKSLGLNHVELVEIIRKKPKVEEIPKMEELVVVVAEDESSDKEEPKKEQDKPADATSDNILEQPKQPASEDEQAKPKQTNESASDLDTATNTEADLVRHDTFRTKNIPSVNIATLHKIEEEWIHIVPVPPQEKICAEDRLVFAGDVQSVLQLHSATNVTETVNLNVKFDINEMIGTKEMSIEEDAKPVDAIAKIPIPAHALAVSTPTKRTSIDAKELQQAEKDFDKPIPEESATTTTESKPAEPAKKLTLKLPNLPKLPCFAGKEKKTKEDEEKELENAFKQAPEFFEVVMSHHSNCIGKTIAQAKFQERYGAAVLAVRHRGENVSKDLSKVVINTGDTILVLAKSEFYDKWINSRDFFVISRCNVDAKPVREEFIVTICKRKFNLWWYPYFSVVVFIAMIATATANIDMIYCSMVACMAMILLGFISSSEAFKSIDWSLLVMIASSLTIGKAISNSGLAAAFASILDYVSLPNFLLPGIVFVLTQIVGAIITNNAAVAIFFPIGMSIAQKANINPRPFAIAICVAASADFATPIGYATNLMIQGPGGYKFLDYVKVGGPLNIIFLILGCVLIPLIWRV